MILRSQSREELLTQLAQNFAQGTKISGMDLRSLNKIVEYCPEDMTAGVEAGLALRVFQDHLSASGQWLPIDPPNAETLTIADLLAFDLFGSRRLGYGTIRDYVIGIKVALADGTLIKAGGKVVKNVAGYDLCKLFIGARHTLGIIVEATFKLRPLPEKETFASIELSNFAELECVRAALLNSRAEPVLFDAQCAGERINVTAAFGGNREDIDAQVEIARSLGFRESSEAHHTREFIGAPDVHKISVLPSRTIATIEQLQTDHWLAYLGNGIIHYRGKAPDIAPMPAKLMDRVKKAYDPKGIFPNYAA